jgi:hypothetical protein
MNNLKLSNSVVKDKFKNKFIKIQIHLVKLYISFF